jgi:hypothetical protein
MNLEVAREPLGLAAKQYIEAQSGSTEIIKERILKELK